MSKDNILKDTFYKERLARTSNGFVKGKTTMFVQPEGEQSDTDAVVISAEQQQLNWQQILKNFGKTTCGTTFAFRELACTHKRLPSLYKISQYRFLEKIDLSFNCLRSLKSLSGLRYLTHLTVTNNQLTTVMQMKEIPLSLDTLDLSYNQIGSIPDLSKHKYLRVLKLSGNKISNISGINNNKSLRVLDLSENMIEEIKGVEGLQLIELYLNSNQIGSCRGLNKLEQLRVLDLSLNRISKLGGLIGLIGLRQLRLAKNNVKHIRQVNFLENLMYLDSLDFSYNPLQERKYYRLQVIYKLPMLKMLDGAVLSGQEVVKAESLYGLDVEEKYNIFRKHLPEEEFVDRRIHRSELIEAETDSEGEGNQLIDEYDDDGHRTNSNNSRSKNSRGFNASKRSGFSKNSKRSSFSKS